VREVLDDLVYLDERIAANTKPHDFSLTDPLRYALTLGGDRLGDSLKL
jgi:hypothetical protein